MGADSTGLVFTNRLDDLSSAANRVLENGSGVAAGDFDGDGRTDLFFCGLAGNSGLFRNLGGWRFTNVTEVAGLRVAGEVCRGAVFVDLNGDRTPDLLVSTLSHGVLCFLNEAGHFREVTAESGLGGRPGSTTLALADVDDNGTLDLYVARYRAEDIRDNSNVEARRVGGRTELHPRYAGRLVVGPTGLIEFGEADALYLNDGKAHFREVSWTDGAFEDSEGRRLQSPPLDWGLTAAFRDINGDGRPDLYVCNDYGTPDRLWLGVGPGRFRLAPGAALGHVSENSMGVDFADLDRDGILDFLVVDMVDADPRVRRRQALAQTRSPVSSGPLFDAPQIMRNTCFRGRGDGTFAEIAEFAGLARSGWSWQPLFIDVDLDGLEDVLLPSGHRRDIQDLDATERIARMQHAWTGHADPAARQQAFTREMMEHGRFYPSLEEPIVAFRNLGGFRFGETTADWGLSEPGVHQGSALVDLDGDGDLDLVVNNLNAAAGCYRNEASGARLAVRLRGLPPNTAGIGARVRLMGGAVALQEQEMAAGGRYLSGSEAQLMFGSGPATNVLSLEVLWRSGRVSRVGKVSADRLYEVDETEAVPASPERTAPAERAWFEDRSAALGHVHHEDAFDEAARQPLLPRLLSRSGPGVAVADLDGNGWPDLILGSGSGGTLSVFTNDGRGGLIEAPRLLDPIPAACDLTGLVTWRTATGGVRVLVGLGPGDASPPTPAAVLELAAGSASGARALDVPGAGSVAVGSTGPLALGDLDGDGSLELFAGGGAVPGRYPEAAPSRVFRRHGAGWVVDGPNTLAIQDVGLVNGAAWGDLDGDGDVDLVLACEWSALRVFRNDAGRLVEATREWGFASYAGLWLGVTLGDLDGDGRLDIVAGNWGWNGEINASETRPAVLLYGDLLHRGFFDLLDGEWDARRGGLAMRRSLAEMQGTWPMIRTGFTSHRAFAEASLDDVARFFGGDLKRREVHTLASTLFFNRPGRFEPVPLPAEAQYAPVFGVIAADFDGDGHEDLFLTQNCRAVPWPTPPLDAGQGLLLRGVGAGRWEVVDAATSGIRLDGDGRGVACADFDGDGRPDLVAVQNSGPTRWYRNHHGAPCLRLRLHAGAGNPDGIGAVVRLGQAGQWGPAHPVLAGSGWWSQSGPEVFLPRPVQPSRLSVRWPDGRVSETVVPGGALELDVAQPRD